VRLRAEAGSDAQAAFSGVRTILVPPDIVAVPRRSPVPVKKRTPWRPQPDGQVVTERCGAREWFADRVFVENGDGHARSGYASAIVLHVVGAAALVAAVLARPAALPAVRERTSLVMPAFMSVMSTPEVLAAPSTTSRLRPTAGGRPQSLPAAAPALPPSPVPVEAPATITPETGAESVAQGAVGDAAGGVAEGTPDPVASGPGASGAGTDRPYRIGGGDGIRPPRKIKDVKPTFPLHALSERANGNVVIEATIGVDGKVERAAIVHSIAALDQAALDAVRQWEYTPPMLNGVAVAVIMMIVVTFTIQ
jgi:periplasmic protein TonB